MRRRTFIALLGGAICWPRAGLAQQPKMPAVGFLHAGASTLYADEVAAFRTGLRESSYVEGQNVAIDYRWANGDFGRLPALAAELVSRKVAVILSGGGAASALAAKAATTTIPIVLAFGSDPVALGLVASLNRPGGNVTGVTFLTTDLTAKRLDILHQVVPQAKMLAYLGDARAVSAAKQLHDVLAAVDALGLRVSVAHVSGDGDFEHAFTAFGQSKAEAVLVAASALFNIHRAKLIALAARYKLPLISQAREMTLAGGLMSYGASFPAAFLLGGRYVARILKGAKPAEMPVMRSTKFEFVINLKTARALGLTIPPNVLAIADEVIE